jgi:hypothetical protein
VGFGGYGYTDSLQFWPTGIDFPEPGCWLVTSSLRKTIVRFVVKYRDLRVAWLARRISPIESAGTRQTSGQRQSGR